MLINREHSPVAEKILGNGIKPLVYLAGALLVIGMIGHLLFGTDPIWRVWD